MIFIITNKMTSYYGHLSCSVVGKDEITVPINGSTSPRAWPRYLICGRSSASTNTSANGCSPADSGLKVPDSFVIVRSN